MATKVTKTKKKKSSDSKRTIEQSKFIIFSGLDMTEAEAIAEAERLFPS